MNGVAVGLGLSVITATHIMMLNEVMPAEVQRNHALINLAAVATVTYGILF
jgi:hypothetical protein